MKIDDDLKAKFLEALLTMIHELPDDARKALFDFLADGYCTNCGSAFRKHPNHEGYVVCNCTRID